MILIMITSYFFYFNILFNYYFLPLLEMNFNILLINNLINQ
jgi:hypothetical protein